ncbi:DUF2971 domain-containing protein [Pseudomonas koreensis]|uniref:DUF2971 domain-containing protein n=1 Tax=Pseudomonas koreensis TaxID=198620 RepID=UPI0032093422
MGNVYKFLGSERRAFLDNGLLRFTQAAALNDPYECLAAFPDVSPEEMAGDLFSGVLERVGYKESDSRQERVTKAGQIGSAFSRIKAMFKDDPWLYRDFAIDLNQRRINNGLGILSLSRRWDSALMWSHYTKTYSGFCIGFDRDHSYFQEVLDGDQSRRTALLPVNYATKRPVIPKVRTDANGLEIFLTKSLDWAYEKEDRLLALLKDASKVIKEKPYDVYLFQIPFDAVTEIILGHKAPESLRIDVIEAGKKLGVPVYKTQLSERSFDVDRSLLKDGICF